MVDSPLHAVLNIGAVLQGLVFLIAAALLRPALLSGRPRRTCAALAVAHAVGISLVGLFHGPEDALDDGTDVLHGLGAPLTIGAGNTAAIVAGARLHRRRSHRFGGTFLALRSLGIAAFSYLLAAAGTGLDGIPERIAICTIMLADLRAGVSVLPAGRVDERSRRSTPPRRRPLRAGRTSRESRSGPWSRAVPLSRPPACRTG